MCDSYEVHKLSIIIQLSTIMHVVWGILPNVHNSCTAAFLSGYFLQSTPGEQIDEHPSEHPSPANNSCEDLLSMLYMRCQLLTLSVAVAALYMYSRQMQAEVRLKCCLTLQFRKPFFCSRTHFRSTSTDFMPAPAKRDVAALLPHQSKKMESCI